MSEGGAVTVSPKVELSLTAAVSDYGGPFLGDLRPGESEKESQEKTYPTISGSCPTLRVTRV
eukprot:scaffold76983_cov14-Tisochrysis_lutea.AAC.1